MNSSMSPVPTLGAINPQDLKDSIINRKRQVKGLSSSFSSNLGRRISLPQSRKTSDSTTKSHNRSVKSIVAWLESASSPSSSPSPSSNADTSKHSSEERIKMDASLASIASSAVGGLVSSQHSQQTLHSLPDVEEYSLTLLKYKKYFTDRPLARCLDGNSSTVSSEESGNNLGCDKTVEASLSKDIQLRNSGNSVSTLSNMAKTQIEPAAFQLIRREPEEVMAF